MSQGWRSQPLPKGWERTRRRILRRDGRRCYLCGANGCRQVDHIVPVIEGGGDEACNLAAICEACHATKTAAEANRHNPMAQPRKRKEEAHPGLTRGGG